MHIYICKKKKALYWISRLLTVDQPGAVCVDVCVRVCARSVFLHTLRVNHKRHIFPRHRKREAGFSWSCFAKVQLCTHECAALFGKHSLCCQADLHLGCTNHSSR